MKIISREFNNIPKSVRRLIVFIEVLFKVTKSGIRTQPEIVHCHDTVALVFGVLISLFIKTEIIYDAHELESRKNGQNRLMSLLVLNIERLFF